MFWSLGCRMIYVSHRIYLLLLRNNTSSRIKETYETTLLRLVVFDGRILDNKVQSFVVFICFSSSKTRAQGLPIFDFSYSSFRRIIFQFRFFAVTPKFRIQQWLIDKRREILENKVCSMFNRSYKNSIYS